MVWAKRGVRQRVELAGVVEQRGLVGLDLQAVLAALLDDGAGGGALAVQGVGGDDLPVEAGHAGEQRSGGGLFATRCPLFLVVEGEGLRGAVVVVD